MIFNCNPSRKHVKYGHCWHKHNAARYDAKVSDHWIRNVRKAQ